MRIAKIFMVSSVTVLLCASCAISNMGKGVALMKKGECANALPYIEKAALSGDKGAAITAGQIYAMGCQVPRDVKKAQHYYELYSSLPEELNGQFYIEGGNWLKAFLMINDSNLENDSEASLIFRSENNKNSPFALVILAKIYSFGIGEPKDITISKKLYERAIKYDKSITSLHEYAWMLVVHPDASFRDPKLALELINKVLQDKKASNSAPILDTLAAVYAENNMFKEAVEAQTNAISKLDELKGSGGMDELHATLECRLLNYKQGRVWHLDAKYSPFGWKPLAKCNL